MSSDALHWLLFGVLLVDVEWPTEAAIGYYASNSPSTLR